jgi:hypothetical protein
MPDSLEYSPRMPVFVIDHRFKCGLLEVLLPLMLILETMHHIKGNSTISRHMGHFLLMLQVKHTKFQVGFSPDRYSISSMRASHSINTSSNGGRPTWEVQTLYYNLHIILPIQVDAISSKDPIPDLWPSSPPHPTWTIL